ncbi:MAG: LSM domain-containing protein [Thermoplasmata archaeon]|nr:LSM domain-containing protein [Thermoplasmata archaeon]
MSGGPAQLMERVLEQRVTLVLKDGRQLTGRLVGIDEHLNLVLEDANETTAEVTRHLGKVVLRGSNVVTLHAPHGTPAKTH